jgi:hypothetical protein
LEALLSPASADTKPASDSTETETELVAMWSRGLRAAFPRAAGGDFLLERRIENALLDGRYFYRITNPAVTALNAERKDWFAYLDDRAGARSVALVYPEALPEGLDLMNRSGARWEHPSGDGRSYRSSYLDLVEEGTGEAARILELLIQALESGGPLEDLAGAIGNGGLSVCDPTGSPLAPKISRPLPLLELMEAEYLRRLEWAKRQASRH